jgi:hypothetical protein
VANSNRKDRLSSPPRVYADDTTLALHPNHQMFISAIDTRRIDEKRTESEAFAFAVQPATCLEAGALHWNVEWRVLAELGADFEF